MFILLFLLFSSVAFSETTCGDTAIVSGSTCNSLKLKWDLTGCEDTLGKDPISVVCSGGTADALLKTGKATYHIGLREISPGVWATLGKPRQYPLGWSLPTLSPSKPVSPPPHSTQSQLLLGSPPRSSSLFDIGGEFLGRYDQRENQGFSKDVSYFSVRGRLNAAFRPDPALLIFLQPQFFKVLGQPLLLPTSTTANSAVSSSGSGVDSSLDLHQAYLDAELWKNWRLIFGRQLLSYGEGQILSDDDFTFRGRSFDAVRVHVDIGSHWVDVFSSKLAENSLETPQQGDRDLHGTYLSFAVADWVEQIEAYGLWLRDHTNSLSNLFTIGIRGKGKVATLLWQAETGIQTDASSGEQANLRLTYPWGATSLGIEAFWSTEDYRPLFPHTHYLGHADLLSRRNLTGLQLLGTWEVSDQWTAMAGLFHFLRTDNNAPVYLPDGSSLGAALASDSLSVGTELDISIKHKPSLAWEISLETSALVPSTYLKAQFPNEVLARINCTLETRF